MSITRLTGLTSGMDTDQLVSDLMKLEQAKIDNVDRDKTKLEWEQEAYRDIIKSVQSFQEEYFDLLNPDTNLRSSTAFSEFTERVQVDGEDVSYVSITGTSAMSDYSHTIGSITQLASADEWTTDALGIGNLTSSALNFSSIPDPMSFSLTIDGVTKTIEISDTSSIVDKDDLVAELDTQIQTEFGADYAGIVTADDTEDKIHFRLDGSEITILETTDYETSVSWLGLESGDSSTDYLEENLSDLFGITTNDLDDMTINGILLSDLGLSSSSSLSELTDAIASSGDIDATLSYNTLNDTFTLVSNDTGSPNDLALSTEFKSFLGFVDDVDHHTSGQNAILELDGTSIIKSSNDFTLDGLQYSLNNTYDGASGDIEIEVDTDTSAIVDKIKSFVETYNGLVATIHGKLNEKKDYDYEPLTDEEKEALSEDEIERWEDNAKLGILRNDSILESMLTSMRTALYESVDDVNITLSDIGIETSSDYKAGGQLVLDEEALTEALDSNYEDVVKLFTQESDKAYLDSDNVTERYEENGLAYRIYDILQNNIRITRDSNGYKGTLLEKAGIENDLTFSDNSLSEMITKYEDRISDLWDDFYDKEESYYITFGRMEAALSEMQAQSNSLASQLG